MAQWQGKHIGRDFEIPNTKWVSLAYEFFVREKKTTKFSLRTKNWQINEHYRHRRRKFISFQSHKIRRQLQITVIQRHKWHLTINIAREQQSNMNSGAHFKYLPFIIQNSNITATKIISISFVQPQFTKNISMNIWLNRRPQKQSINESWRPKTATKH